jgi:predicted house-cleaning noncanonical NTP pyrophosphatase (MazG superfamily)
LVRDLIPDLIRADGGHPVTRHLNDAEFHAALLDKLLEEAREAREARDGELLGELADVLEVLAALVQQQGWTWDDIEQARQSKRSSRGAFTTRTWLETAP